MAKGLAMGLDKGHVLNTSFILNKFKRKFNICDIQKLKYLIILYIN